MELKVDGNPGQGNTYEEKTYQHVDDYYDHPTIYRLERGTRMDTYFQRLIEEIQQNVKAEIIDELLYYTTEKDGTLGMERKFTDGGFREESILEALKQKEFYAKKSMRYDCYPSAQKIFLLLFARIKNEFNTSIYPLIEAQQPLPVVMSQLRQKIVNPIMDMLDAHGAHDQYLNFTEDHIYGMIYYLTGMCHLNWKDYDNV